MKIISCILKCYISGILQSNKLNEFFFALSVLFFSSWFEDHWKKTIICSGLFITRQIHFSYPLRKASWIEVIYTGSILSNWLVLTKKLMSNDVVTWRTWTLAHYDAPANNLEMNFLNHTFNGDGKPTCENASFHDIYLVALIFYLYLTIFYFY